MPRHQQSPCAPRFTTVASIPSMPVGRTLIVASLLMLSACQSVKTPGNTIPDQKLVRAVSPDVVQVETTEDSKDIHSAQLPAEEPIAEGWYETIQTVYDEARRLVEQETNTNLSHVSLSVVDDNEINTEVAAETERLIFNQFSNTRFAKQFLSQVMKGQAGTYAALYTSRQPAILVSNSLLNHYEQSLPNNAALRRSALLTLLIHELVHAADDQRYSIHDNRSLNFRASFAQSATFEGHAQWVTRKICTIENCLDGLDALDTFMFNRGNPPNQLTQTVQAISRNVLEYSYVEGERFIRELSKREDGEELIEQLLTEPPHDPIEILAPRSFPNTEREMRNQHLLQASRNIDHPWVQNNWTAVESSPLKGVNLRADPSRREAAVDGFTRLISAMVAVQLYDQDNTLNAPFDITLIQAESVDTARLFGSTLHGNSRLPGSDETSEQFTLRGNAPNDAELEVVVHRSVLTETDSPYYTVIAAAGSYVVQISGKHTSVAPFEDYVMKVLLALHRTTGTS